ncbi:MAG: twitching motility protein PilT [Pedosphaera sp.]|nr:twitching motility protein PilT [Pedosphaera sp.]
MLAFADTGFIASLYLKESTSAQARKTIQAAPVVLPITPLAMLELRNAFNRSVQRQLITLAQRDALWQDVETDIASGFLVLTPVTSEELHTKARQLSDRYTPTLGTRSLDLLHVAAALVLKAKDFFSFDDRQRKAAASEGLKVKP